MNANVAILGCGRSGTSIFGELFEAFPGYRYWSEPHLAEVRRVRPPLGHDQRTRLRPPDLMPGTHPGRGAATLPGMAFSGWPGAAIDFYDGLEMDNSKDYWQANLHVYQQSVIAPFHLLLEELHDEFGAGKLFRPNRDVRFSADKSPYKTQAGAMLDSGGYVQLSATGLGVGAGYYMIEPPKVAALREAIADDRTGSRLVEIVDDLRAVGAEVTGRDAVKTAPRGYSTDHPRIDLLRLKGLIAWWQYDPGAWLATAEAKDRIVDALRASSPLMEWLDTEVGR